MIYGVLVFPSKRKRGQKKKRKKKRRTNFFVSNKNKTKRKKNKQIKSMAYDFQMGGADRVSQGSGQLLFGHGVAFGGSGQRLGHFDVAQQLRHHHVLLPNTHTHTHS